MRIKFLNLKEQTHKFFNLNLQFEIADTIIASNMNKEHISRKDSSGSLNPDAVLMHLRPLSVTLIVPAKGRTAAHTKEISVGSTYPACFANCSKGQKEKVFAFSMKVRLWRWEPVQNLVRILQWRGFLGFVHSTVFGPYGNECVLQSNVRGLGNGHRHLRRMFEQKEAVECSTIKEVSW